MSTGPCDHYLGHRVTHMYITDCPSLANHTEFAVCLFIYLFFEGGGGKSEIVSTLSFG